MSIEGMRFDRLEGAIVLAAGIHQGMRDRGGEPLILHCIHVMTHVRPQDEVHRMVAVLHDTIESGATIFELSSMGVPEPVLLALDAISRREDEPYDDYITRVIANPVARRVKIADLEHNMDLSRIRHKRELKPSDTERHAKYQAALYRLLAAEDQA